MSVVIPHFNQPDFAEAAIKSVLAQTVMVGEVILVDDFSEPLVYQKLKRNCNNFPVTFIRLNINSGTPAVPRNVGVAAAKRDWVAFLDADDLWHPMKIERQLQVINQLSKDIMVCTEMVDFSDASPGTFLSDPYPAGQCLYEMISYRDQLVKYRTPLSSIMMPTSWMRDFPFPEDLRLRGREDVINIWRIQRRHGQAVKLSHPMIGYRRHCSQISKAKIKLFIIQMLSMWPILRLDHGPVEASAYWLCFVVTNAYLNLVREIRGRL